MVQGAHVRCEHEPGNCAPQIMVWSCRTNMKTTCLDKPGPLDHVFAITPDRKCAIMFCPTISTCSEGTDECLELCSGHSLPLTWDTSPCKRLMCLLGVGTCKDYTPAYHPNQWLRGVFT